MTPIGLIYLAVILDAWSRRVVGYALALHMMPATAANVAAGRRCDAGSCRRGAAALPARPAGTPRIVRGARSERPILTSFRGASSATAVRSFLAKPALRRQFAMLW